MAGMGEAERRAAVLGCFARLYGPRAESPLDYAEQEWSAEEWSGGGPTSNFGPGGWTEVGPALREPVGRSSLGRHGDGHRLERLHGGGTPSGRPRRDRGS